MTISLALVATGPSALALLALCIGDPKRNRAAGIQTVAQTKRMRQLLTVTACLPGLICALIGDAAAFLIWLGGLGIVGWSLAVWFGDRTGRAK